MLSICQIFRKEDGRIPLPPEGSGLLRLIFMKLKYSATKKPIKLAEDIAASISQPGIISTSIEVITSGNEIEVSLLKEGASLSAASQAKLAVKLAALGYGQAVKSL